MLRVCCRMMPLCVLLLMIGPSVTAVPSRQRVIYKESGDSVTVTCSSVGCLRSTDYAGFYVYHEFITQEEVLYASKAKPSLHPAAVRQRYRGRVQANRSFENTSVTITNVTVDDSGIYTCVFKKDLQQSSKCQVYIVVIKGNASCPVTMEEETPSFLLVLVAVFASLSTLFITAVLLFIALKVKHWKKGRKLRRGEPQLSCVYEVMTKKDFQHVEAPQASPQDPQGSM